MKNLYWVAITCVVVAPATFTAGFVLGTNWPQQRKTDATSFEECVLAEMRGQAKSLQDVARRLCRDRFPRPVAQDASEPLDFSAESIPADAVEKTIVPKPKPLPEGFVLDEESPAQ